MTDDKEAVAAELAQAEAEKEAERAAKKHRSKK